MDEAGMFLLKQQSPSMDGIFLSCTMDEARKFL